VQALSKAKNEPSIEAAGDCERTRPDWRQRWACLRNRGAGIAISVGGTSGALRDALRDKPPAELEKDGRQILVSMGISEAAMNAF
jgi:hypothetical protein